MNQKQQALYQHIDEILFYQWDPIGVSSGNGFRHEYETYIPELFQLILNKCESLIIVDYLTQARKRMGLSESLDQDLKIAGLLLNHAYHFD